MIFFPNGQWCAPADLRIATHAAMQDLGRELAAQLRAGDLVVLTGPLGAGKTTLVQGIGEGLRVRGPVTSPTFVIARVHPPLSGSGPSLVHADAYGDARTVRLTGHGARWHTALTGCADRL